MCVYEMLNSGKNHQKNIEQKIKQNAIENFSLPPNVNGQCRGRLSLCLLKIDWFDDIPFNFDKIQTKAIWWGDSINSCATVKLRNRKVQKSTLEQSGDHTNILYYRILTKLKLFKKYLTSSAGVELCFTSATSNLTIGRAMVPIPKQMIEFIDKHQSDATMNMQKFRSECYIHNPRNKAIGKILVDYDLTLCNRPISNDEEIYTQNKNNVNFINIKPKVPPTSRVLIKIKDRKTNQLPTVDESGKVLRKNSQSRLIINYLSGRNLSDYETNQALKSLKAISPSGSLIDLLSNDLDCLHLHSSHQKRTLDSAHAQMILDQVDSIRTHVYEMTLTRASIHKILNHIDSGSYSSGKFIVNVNMDAIESTDIQTYLTSDIVHIFTSTTDYLPSIHFEKYSIQKIHKFNSTLNDVVHLTIRYRDILSNRSCYFGTAEIKLKDIVKNSDLTFIGKCPIKMKSVDVIIGEISVKIELGCRNSHFDSEYLDAVSSDKTIHGLPLDRHDEVTQNMRETCQDIIENNDQNAFLAHDLKLNEFILRSCMHDEHSDRNSGSSISAECSANQTQHTNRQSMNGRLGGTSNNSHVMGLNDSPSMPDSPNDTLQGLFYVGQCSSLQATGKTFLICRPFWSSDILVTECYESRREDNCYLNYLEMFSVLSNDQLNRATKHNFMDIELWRRSNDETNTIVGIAKVSLHQFFIAFNNAHIRNHVTKQKIPVISIDGWVTITSSLATSDAPIGTVQVILAVGTSEQIAKFKISKSLTPCKLFKKLSPDAFPLDGQNVENPMPAAIAAAAAIPIREPQAQYSQRPPIEVPVQNESNVQQKSLRTQLSDDRQANLAAMLSNFIDNLALKLPERNNGDGNDRQPLESRQRTTNSTNATTQTLNDFRKGGNNNSNAAASLNKNLRPTSELLDELQRALSIAPTPAQRDVFQCKTNEEKSGATPPEDVRNTTNENETRKLARKMFRIYFEIDCALHLPIESNVEPSTYVSFEAFAPYISNDECTQGSSIVYKTNVVVNSSSPQWNKQYEVSLPVEFLNDDQKRFTLNIWRKSYPEATPSSSDLNTDTLIGNASIDLSVLVACLPSIDGWFNIIHTSGSINGQIKVQIKPNASDLEPYINQYIASQKDQIQESSPMNMFLKDFDDSALSRALKRKFTELEEITQRLRARLFDVTGDSDDQFEQDLNTVPEES